MGAIAAVTAAAAAARRKRIQASMAFGVVEVPWGEFLRALALEPEPLVVRANVKKMWGPESWRYLASVKGMVFFAEGPPDAAFPESAIVIEAEKIRVPKDL
jgi:hypothetical protein